MDETKRNQLFVKLTSKNDSNFKIVNTIEQKNFKLIVTWIFYSIGIYNYLPILLSKCNHYINVQVCKYMYIF